VCTRYTRAYLRHLAVAAEPLSAVLNTLHNLAFYLETMARMRESMGRGIPPLSLTGVGAGARSE
jgi:queuine tRNA-ribosyltransferase